MNSSDILLLGLKHRVAAVSRQDGHILWSTDIKGGMGNGFVTITADHTQVFAYSDGHLHCLELLSGRILWSNELQGYGYGMASLAIPGALAASPAGIAQIMHNAAVAGASAATAAAASA